MAQMIDMAARAEAAIDPTDVRVEILTPERVCLSGDVERIAEFVDIRESEGPQDGQHVSYMRLTTLTSGGAMLRIHTCPTCGRERRFGGRAY